jgi:hypothetical protein
LLSSRSDQALTRVEVDEILPSCGMQCARARVSHCRNVCATCWPTRLSARTEPLTRPYPTASILYRMRSS